MAHWKKESDSFFDEEQPASASTCDLEGHVGALEERERHVEEVEEGVLPVEEPVKEGPPAWAWKDPEERCRWSESAEGQWQRREDCEIAAQSKAEIAKRRGLEGSGAEMSLERISRVESEAEAAKPREIATQLREIGAELRESGRLRGLEAEAAELRGLEAEAAGLREIATQLLLESAELCESATTAPERDLALAEQRENRSPAEFSQCSQLTPSDGEDLSPI